MDKMKKICRRCGKKKPIEEFHEYLAEGRWKGRKNICKTCKSERSKAWYKENIQRERRRTTIRRIREPWMQHYLDANHRCLNPNNPAYKYYGGRGIKQLMSLKDFRSLWFRDKAYLLKRPSIHRKNNDKNYTIKNCEFLEHSKHVKRHWEIIRKGKNEQSN
jgi:hypothetical protein